MSRPAAPMCQVPNARMLKCRLPSAKCRLITLLRAVWLDWAFGTGQSASEQWALDIGHLAYRTSVPGGRDQSVAPLGLLAGEAGVLRMSPHTCYPCLRSVHRAGEGAGAPSCTRARLLPLFGRSDGLSDQVERAFSAIRQPSRAPGNAPDVFLVDLAGTPPLQQDSEPHGPHHVHLEPDDPRRRSVRAGMQLSVYRRLSPVGTRAAVRRPCSAPTSIAIDECTSPFAAR